MACESDIVGRSKKGDIVSGGSLDYIYRRVDGAVENIISCSQNPLHIAFAKHLIKVSKALHDLEWVYSGDLSEPDEEDAIRAVLNQSAEIEITGNE